MSVVIVVFRVHNVDCCYCLVYPAFLAPALAVFWFRCLLLLLCFVFNVYCCYCLVYPGFFSSGSGNVLVFMCVVIVVFAIAVVIVVGFLVLDCGWGGGDQYYTKRYSL